MHLISGRGKQWFAPVDIWPNIGMEQKAQDNRPYTTLVQVEGFYWDPDKHNAYIYGKANHNYYLLAWFSEGWCISQEGAFAHPDNNKNLKSATIEYLDFMIAIT